MSAGEDKEPEERAVEPDGGGAGANQPALGGLLVAARERRGCSAQEAAERARIPAHYIRMMESDDYGLISDRIYLLPFIRKYATFLDLDGEEMAMRFVRDVQRTDSTAPRMGPPIAIGARSRWPWRVIAVVIVIVILAVAAFALRARMGRLAAFASASFHHSAPPGPAAANVARSAALARR